MPSLIFGPWCLLFGHRRNATSRRTEDSNVFGNCSVCGREMYRDPAKGKWRIAIDADRRPRGMMLSGDETVAAPKKSRRSSRSRSR